MRKAACAFHLVKHACITALEVLPTRLGFKQLHTQSPSTIACCCRMGAACRPVRRCGCFGSGAQPVGHDASHSAGLWVRRLADWAPSCRLGIVAVPGWAMQCSMPVGSLDMSKLPIVCNPTGIDSLRNLPPGALQGQPGGDRGGPPGDAAADAATGGPGAFARCALHAAADLRWHPGDVRAAAHAGVRLKDRHTERVHRWTSNLCEILDRVGRPLAASAGPLSEQLRRRQCREQIVKPGVVRQARQQCWA